MKYFHNFDLKLFIFRRFKRWKSTRWGIVMILGIFVVFINEFLCYKWARFNWPDIEKLANK